MNQSDVLRKTKEYIYMKFSKDVTGHGPDHMERVATWCRTLAREESEDPFLAELAGWLHDVDDQKLVQDPKQAREERMEWLLECGLTKDDVNAVEEAIDTVSYRKGKKPTTRLAEIVQDADRLDAIGAIGIARTFAFGGSKGQLLHSDDPDEPTSIRHFHDKLLRIHSLMNTTSGKREASHRHELVLQFLREYEREQNIKGETTK
ncbi:HD domain-containing protein [Halobacillus locisalis]|uniref:HD domain-containing protein n=1 Tax=Halobacillus locisalis TaxID=220753 RepID=A0A838CPY5_9BACI|nr:HD domain-containing protein [Halobacillus locisalis]MBA2173933.1 HD domain-containing protein [Halobacillus locisalis]